MSIYQIGNTVGFEYNGKARCVKIEKVQKTSGNAFFGPMTKTITGWDFTADAPVGGYRSFSVEKIIDPKLVG
jgi:hypothetical protein